MRFVQFLRKNDKRTRLGVVSEDGTKIVELSSGSCIANDMRGFISQNYSLSELQQKLENAKTEEMNDNFTLLPPITNPDKIICIGLNYRDHCEEQNKKPPTEPMFFSKFNNTLTGPLGNMDKAMDFVFGYSVAQDISARDWQKERVGFEPTLPLGNQSLNLAP
ncbi:Fumarylacetoacetate hydrolase domain-containing protein 2 [Eumeta japonica]|uniref:Fumarylacetoacetate hydrolase domain-containing protein 2 n=1 Tax=Eumeta variegata TaxID=151549 RepID=A0A4C2AFA0_EUMVA|nr:Fumarylacetoacetate hydrolase domain-containing protein 2 [Eumeta japonica]